MSVSTFWFPLGRRQSLSHTVDGETGEDSISRNLNYRHSVNFQEAKVQTVSLPPLLLRVVPLPQIPEELVQGLWEDCAEPQSSWEGSLPSGERSCIRILERDVSSIPRVLRGWHTKWWEVLRATGHRCFTLEVLGSRTLMGPPQTL